MMSDEKQEVPVLSFLDQMKQQHAVFVQQKDLAQNNLNQLVGAIYACGIMIKKLEEEDAAKEISQENLGDSSHDEADNESAESNS